MGINYNAVAKNVRTAIKTAGALIQFVGKGNAVVDPIKGTSTSNPITYSAYGVVDGVNQAYITRVGPSNVLAGDELCYLEVSGYVPTLADKCITPKGTYSIVNVEPISPAFVDVLYILQLRK